MVFSENIFVYGCFYLFIKNYFKNYFVNESTSASPSTTCNFCGRGGHISSICSLRNGSEKNSNAKAKKIWVEKYKVTNPQEPQKDIGT